MTLVLARPIRNMHNQVKSPMHTSNRSKNEGGAIKTNIIDDLDQVKIMLALPGFKKEEVKIRVEHERLVVEGKVVQESKEETVSQYHLKQFTVNDFKKNFLLNDDIDVAAIDAKYADGILMIVLPKKEKIRKEISVS